MSRYNFCSSGSEKQIVPEEQDTQTAVKRKKKTLETENESRGRNNK